MRGDTDVDVGAYHVYVFLVLKRCQEPRAKSHGSEAKI